MTCVAGYTHDGWVGIAADRAASNPSVIYDTVEPKVFRNGPFIMGYAGSFRFGQVMQYQFEAPPHRAGISAMAYICTDFTHAMRAYLKANGITDITNSVETAKGTALIGYNGQLFEMDWDFHFAVRPFAAIGGGFLPALGAMTLMEKLEREREDMVGKFAWMDKPVYAVEVAAETNPFVRGPIDLETLEPGTRAPLPPGPPKNFRNLWGLRS